MQIPYSRFAHSQDLHIIRTIRIMFSKKCFCKKREEEFSSNRALEESSITQFFCPDCSNRAPDEAILFEVEDIPGKLGVYGITWNKAELRRMDLDFRDEEDYYGGLLSEGGVTLKCLADEEKAPVIWDKENEDEVLDALGGKDYLLGDEGEEEFGRAARGGRDDSS